LERFRFRFALTPATLQGRTVRHKISIFTTFNNHLDCHDSIVVKDQAGVNPVVPRIFASSVARVT